MKKRKLSRERIRRLQRVNYTEGTRILLLHMEDPWPVPDNTRGTVDHVDDAGQIHCRFDDGRYLAVVPGVDRFRRLTEKELSDEQK